MAYSYSDQWQEAEDASHQLQQFADELERSLLGSVDAESFLLDPDGERIAHEQYGEAFLALAVAAGDALRKEPAPNSAIKGLLRVVTSQYGKSASYHYDFVNLALVLTANIYDRMGWPKEPLLNPRMNRLARLQHSTVKASNWRAMRLLVAKANGKKLRGIWESLALKLNTDADGWVHDIRAVSFPVQYSIYTAALFELGSRWFGLPATFRRSASTTYDQTHRIFESPLGFNTQGRGYQQIFGYGPWIYLASQREDWRTVTSALHLLEKNTASSQLRLVLSETGDRIGRYDYHYSSVYQAFLLAWLRLTQLDTADPWVAASGPHAMIRSGGWRVRISRGGNKYAAESALSPHSIFYQGDCLSEGIAGPDGGRHSRKRGTSALRFVCCSPIILNASKDPIALLGRRNRISAQNGSVVVSFENQQIRIRRTISVNQGLLFTDEIFAKKPVVIRCVNVPILLESSDRYSVSSSAGGLETEERVGLRGPYKVYFRAATLQKSEALHVKTQIRDVTRPA